MLHTSVTNTQLVEEAQEQVCGGRKMNVDGGGGVRRTYRQPTVLII